MPSVEMQKLIEEINAMKAVYGQSLQDFKPDPSGLPPEVVLGRKTYAMFGSRLILDASVQVELLEVGGIPTELVWAEGASHEYAVVLLHGGGWSWGSPPEYRQMAGRISKESNACVFVPAYRLAPENVFPAALDDCYTVYKAVLMGGHSAKKISLGGSSAGSALSIGSLLLARDAGLPMPASMWQISPAVDLTCKGPIFNDPDFPDVILSPTDLKGIYGRYLAGHDPADPLVSPVYADLKGLPPLYVEVGGHERLIEDAQLLVTKAKQCGVNASLYVCDEAIHAFPFFAGNTPEARECMKRIGQHVRTYFGSM